MSNWNDLKAAIINVIKTNGNQEITGIILQAVLNTIISNLGQYASFAGVATPATKPGTPDGKVYYIASEAGTYANFNGITLNDGEVAILWNINGVWEKLSTNIATKSSIDNLVKSTVAFLTGGEYVQRDKDSILIPAYLVNGTGQSEDSLLLYGATEFEAGLMTGSDRVNMNNLMEAVFPLQVIFDVNPKIAEYDGGSCPVIIDYEIRRNGGLVDTPTVVITRNGEELYRCNENKKQIIDDAREKITKYYIDAGKNNLVQGQYITVYRISPMYFGFNSDATLNDLKVLALNKQEIKSAPTGTYMLTNDDNNYMWLCVPEEMEITNVSLNGFTVPMETAQTVSISIGAYKCYRSSNILIAGIYEITIKGTSTIITGEENNEAINPEDINNLKKVVEKNTNDIIDLQENGLKSVGNYFFISASSYGNDDTTRNYRLIYRNELEKIVDYINKLESKYPEQYQFFGNFIVHEYTSLTDGTDISYNKMRIYHVENYYKMSLTAQDIVMDEQSKTGKCRLIIRGIDFICDTNNIQDETITKVKEVHCNLISVPEQVLSETGDMKYQNLYKVLTNDGTYKEIKELIGIDLIKTGNGEKFLADNGQYIEIEIETFTLTVTATPAEAQIKINGVIQSSISVKKGTEVTVEVSLRGYFTKTEKITVNENITKEIILEEIPELPTTNKEELDMNVYKVWAKSESGSVKFDTTSTAAIKEFLSEINSGNLALLYMTQPIVSKPRISDYIQMSLFAYNATGFSAIGTYQSEEWVGVGSLSQYLVVVKSDGGDGYTATYSLLTVSLQDLNFNTAFNLPRQYRTSITYSSGKYSLTEMNSDDIKSFIKDYNNMEDIIAKARAYLTITKINDLGGTPSEVPFDIYPDVYNSGNIGRSGVVLHGISRNADTQGRRLELEISGDTGSQKYTITKCQYVNYDGTSIE